MEQNALHGQEETSGAEENDDAPPVKRIGARRLQTDTGARNNKRTQQGGRASAHQREHAREEEADDEERPGGPDLPNALQYGVERISPDARKTCHFAHPTDLRKAMVRGMAQDFAVEFGEPVRIARIRRPAIPGERFTISHDASGRRRGTRGRSQANALR